MQESLFSQADSPASHSVLPGSSEARQMTAISGRKCCESYARQGQLGSLVRMLLASSTWHSTRCILTWKQKVTKSNRSLFQLAVSMPRTKETGFGLWATPNSMDSLPPRQAEDCSTNQKNREGRSRSGNLREQVVHPQMWPTPTVDNAANVNPKDNRFRCLVRAVNESVMYPTPSARDYKDTGELKAVIRKDGKNRIDTLGRVVTAGGMHIAGSLNPTWVEWLMGYPIEHTVLKDWATPSSRKSRQKSSETST